jgi:hypothetical protein
VVTLIFLRPIYIVLSNQDRLGNRNAAAQRSAAYRSLQKTKYMTLAGASLAVVSSTALYINMGLFFVLGGHGKPFYANAYLYMFVFGTNLDSVLNDVGMLLACGVITTFWASWTQGKTTVAPVGNAPLAHHGLNSGTILPPSTRPLPLLLHTHPRLLTIFTTTSTATTTTTSVPDTTTVVNTTTMSDDDYYHLHL